MKVRTQSKRTILVALLVTSPWHRITHTLHLDLGSEFQSLKLCSLWQHKLRLPELSGRGLTGIQATTPQRFPVFTFHSYAQNARNTRDAIVGKADSQSQIATVFIAPDH